MDKSCEVRLLLIGIAKIVSCPHRKPVYIHQERGSRAVDVHKVIPGTYRESTAVCGSRSSVDMPPSQPDTQPRRRATGMN